jgi:CrcB protein
VIVWVAIAVLGGVGAVLRFLLDRAVARRAALLFPLGTLAVNVSGAALLGVVSGLALSPAAAMVAGTALIGSYTTFSTWMLETHRLGEERQLGLAAANIVLSVVFGLAAAMAGQLVVGWL